MPFPIDLISYVNYPLSALHDHKNSSAASSSNNQQNISDIAHSAFIAQKNPSLEAPTKNKIVSQKLDYNSLTATDRANINVLFKKLCNTNMLSLAWKRKELEALGAKLDTIHPLAVWKYVLMDSDLKQCVEKIKRKTPVWDALLKEYAAKLQSQYSQGNITDENVKNFLESVKYSDKVSINKNTDWLNFLTSVIQNVYNLQ